jgi:hypothetical protein
MQVIPSNPNEEEMTATPDGTRAIRAALDEIGRTAERCAATFTAPAAPGKWSPSQVVEHVARSLEAGAADMAGRRSAQPGLPAPLRFLARKLLFERVLRNKAFPRARTNKAMNPESGPPTPADAKARLDAAFRAFATACEAQRGAAAASLTFGTVSLTDYIAFQAIHTVHHGKQLIRA